MPWNWETYGEYLNSIEAMGPGINLCGIVGHCAIRFYVMGERAIDEPEGSIKDWMPTRMRYETDSLLDAEGTGLRRPTENEIKQIAALAGQSNLFAGGAAPNGAGLPQWERYSEEYRPVMLLDETSSVARDSDETHRKLWESTA